MNRRYKNRLKAAFLRGTAYAAFIILLFGMASIDYTPMSRSMPAIIFPMMWLGVLGYAQVR